MFFFPHRQRRKKKVKLRHQNVILTGIFVSKTQNIIKAKVSILLHGSRKEFLITSGNWCNNTVALIY